jgi:hypothetical protein
MNEILHRRPIPKNSIAELTREEKAQLNTIIDLLIPSDEYFPPPSSLQLIDEFLLHFSSRIDYYTPRMLNLKKLRSVLRELDNAAEGSFCTASPEQQQRLLRSLEQRDPAFFQELWTLANHSYYARMAIYNPVALPTSASFA